MNGAQKHSLLQAALTHIEAIRLRIHAAMNSQAEKSAAMSKAAIRMMPGDAIAQRRLAAHRAEQAENLKALYPSPYFTRCDFVTKGEKKEMYFGKFSFSEEGIYSWITPAATLRFEDPGKAGYTRPDGTEQTGIIQRKDQYMIVDGKLLFFSMEGVGQPRELIHQEHFTRQKSGFILPEVVEQMEKAQDQVIRASYQDPLIISGPAGSGKTTLALHRVAYLMQSPETAEFFQPRDILVLVQDVGTKAYFSQLLPDLGINGVAIYTFSEWALQVLGLEGYTYTTDYGHYEPERTLYEYAKLLAVKRSHAVAYNKRVYPFLKTVYETVLTKEQHKILAWQTAHKILDRFDLTLLLSAYHNTVGPFELKQEVYEELSNNHYRKKVIARKAQYNLLIVDEYQNYIPQQLQLLTSCVNPRTRSAVYVGDAAQQTQLGTIRSERDAYAMASNERTVVLQKVYRNTKEILGYIKSLGYGVDIPVSLKSGPEVTEKFGVTIEEQMQHIDAYCASHPGVMVGVLSRDKQYLEPFKAWYDTQSTVRCMSFYEAQGVEFDTVIIVQKTSHHAKQEYPIELQKQVEHIEKDLLYVALTRAMNELHVLAGV